MVRQKAVNIIYKYGVCTIFSAHSFIVPFLSDKDEIEIKATNGATLAERIKREVGKMPYKMPDSKGKSGKTARRE